jgi:hypothetical protein
MTLCPAGSSPKPAAPSSVWISQDDIQRWVGLNQYAMLAPWIWNMATELVDVPTLCSTEPEQLAGFTNLDLQIASSNPVSAFLFVQDLKKYARWQAWSENCQCNGAAACTTETYHLVLGTNMCFRTDGPTFQYPTVGVGANNTCTRTYIDWPSSCATVDVTVWLGEPGSPGQPQLVTHIWSGQGQIYAQSHIMGTPQTVTLGAGIAGLTGYGLHVAWDWNVDPHNYPNWTLVVTPHTTVGPPTPAPGPPVININIPIRIGPTCGTISDVCQIIWNTQSYQNVINSNTYINALPPAYQGGVETTIQGQGEHRVAPGTLALSVTVLANPPALDPRPDDPAEYWDLGWIRTGNAVGWDRKAWIRTSGQRIFPPWPTFDRFAWTLADGVMLNVQELMPVV